MKIGIQGGKGSFNEEAYARFVDDLGIVDVQVVYCYTTENVLQQLTDGRIDRGVFAIYNSTSRLVDETADVLGHYAYDVVTYATIPVRHCLMTLPERESDNVQTIMGHPEALFQCKETLVKHYGAIATKSGTGDQIDSAAIAALLAKGELSPDIAILGSRMIAQAYGLHIIAEELQDDPSNTTTFLFVQKYIL